MACGLTQGFNAITQCRSNVGGVTAIYLIEYSALSGSNAITYSSGSVSAIALNAGKKFYQYVPARETATFTDPSKTDPAAGTTVYNPVIEFSIPTWDVNKRNEFELINQSDLCAIVKQNGNYLLAFSQNGGTATQNDFSSGTKFGDFAGTKFKIEGSEPFRSLFVSGSLVSTLI